MRFKIEIRKVITHNFWLKFISLIIAIIVWLFASGIFTKIKEGVSV